MQISLASLPASARADLLSAAQAYREADAALRHAGTNPVQRLLDTTPGAPFIELAHLPAGDVYDARSGAQYYYHAHRKERGEHGHFHTFVRAAGLPTGLAPPPDVTTPDRPLGEAALCHLIAVSMNAAGAPCGLFTTNRWVTDETFYWADDVVAALPAFRIEQATPCALTNGWLTALVALFRPQVERLVRTRDAAILAWRAQNAGTGRDVFEDRALDITSEAAIDVHAQLAAVDDLAARN